MHVLGAKILVGIGHGLMEAPLITYIGEITYVKNRAIVNKSRLKEKKRIKIIANHHSGVCLWQDPELHQR